MWGGTFEQDWRLKMGTAHILVGLLISGRGQIFRGKEVKLKHVSFTKTKLSNAVVIISYDPDKGAEQCASHEASHITKKFSP